MPQSPLEAALAAELETMHAALLRERSVNAKLRSVLNETLSVISKNHYPAPRQWYETLTEAVFLASESEALTTSTPDE